MFTRLHHHPKRKAPQNAVISSNRMRSSVAQGKRARGVEVPRVRSFVPPEDWYEPSDEGVSDYRIVEQSPGEGFSHVLSPADIRERLSQFPAEMVTPLEVVQFSRMTRKKMTFPCYGMQWGRTIYLYPIETSLVERFTQPPRPSQLNEARMYGGRWEQQSERLWTLAWTPESIRDFYLNNILIHELGHLLDERNTSYQDRERYAEWFAIEYGYKPTRANRPRVTRRHGPR